MPYLPYIQPLCIVFLDQSWTQLLLLKLTLYSKPTLLFIWYLWCGFPPPTLTTLHLLMLNRIYHLSLHSFIISKFACKAMPSESDLINVPIFVSFTNIISLLIALSKSLRCITNDNGHKTHPGGFPLISGSRSKLVMFVKTFCKTIFCLIFFFRPVHPDFYQTHY